MLNCLCLHWNWQVLLHTFLLYITNNQMLKVNLVMLLQNCLFITDRWSRILKTPHMHNQLFLILVSEVFCHACPKLETISILNYNASKWPWYLLHIFLLELTWNSMSVGFWWGHLWARQFGWGVLQGQHSDHAAPARQPDPMDLWHQCEFPSFLLISLTFLVLFAMVLIWPCSLLQLQEDGGDEIKEAAAPKESGEGQ
jgi:hypothetical protein